MGYMIRAGIGSLCCDPHPPPPPSRKFDHLCLLLLLAAVQQVAPIPFAVSACPWLGDLYSHLVVAEGVQHTTSLKPSFLLAWLECTSTLLHSRCHFTNDSDCDPFQGCRCWMHLSVSLFSQQVLALQSPEATMCWSLQSSLDL